MNIILRWDRKFPVIVYFFIVSLLSFSLASIGVLGDLGEAYTHFIHDHSVHYLLMLSGLWVFFLRLGAEIEIADILKAGPLVIGSVLGGVLIPMGFTTALVYLVGGGVTLAVALYASAGSMATDVPMALGSARATSKLVVPVMLTALMILAVGDDLLGVLALTGMFAQGWSQWDALGVEAAILLFCWLVGKRGDIEVKEIHEDREQSLGIFDFTIKTPVFWLVVAILNTYYLGRQGIEPILGGCLVFIFAPAVVKHLIAEKLEALALWLLIPFALVAGAVNIFQAEAWGVFTMCAMVGGFVGKTIGIYGGGMIGRRYSDLDSDYGPRFTRASMLSMALAGACNGTVAIIFVSVAESKGLIPVLMASQMKIGFLLTVPLSYLGNWLLSISAPRSANIPPAV